MTNTTVKDGPILEIKDYSFWYVRQDGSKKIKTLVLDNVNLTINRGEFVLMIGPTSSGKTTLCLNILGILPDLLGGLSKGTIRIHDGRRLVSRKEIPKSRRFLLANMVFQDPNDQMVSLTVEDEIAFALENYEVEREEMAARIDEALAIVGMSNFKDVYVSTLSGGEKQRVAIAAMLALQPRLLLLDQPTSNLDPVGTMEVLEAISNIRRKLDITILLVEQAIDGIFETVDKVLLFDEKRIAFAGTPRELVGKYGMDLRDKFGLWMPQAPHIGVSLRHMGIRVDPLPIDADEIVGVLTSIGLNRETPLPPGILTEKRFERRTEDDPVLAVRHLHFSYPTRKNVLQDISFDVYPGEFVAVLGQNGSGKTTLISHLPGILKPTSGDVIIKGMNTRDKSIQELARYVAFVFQYPDRQFIANTVEGELAHGLKAMGTPPERQKQLIEEFLRRIELTEHRHEHPYSLSHGQKRRLSVACMQIFNPELIVLDEPTFGLDYRQVTSLMDYLYELSQEQKTTVMFVTHDMRLVARYAQRTIVLHKSRLLFDSPPGELFSDEEVLRQTNLHVPPVLRFARRTIGRGLYQPEELIKLAAEVVAR